PYVGPGAPNITLPPQGGIICTGQSLALSVFAQGTLPMTFQWLRDNIALANDARISGAQARDLVINPFAAADAGDYKVHIVNADGEVFSTPVTIGSRDPAAFTTSPADVTACIGESALLLVSVTGTTPLTLQWQQNGIDVPGATTATLAIAALS